MISFESEKSINNIYLLIDKEGIDDLIGYLNYIKHNNESFHLVLGNEIEENPIIKGNSAVGHVKLIYLDEQDK